MEIKKVWKTGLAVVLVAAAGIALYCRMRPAAEVAPPAPEPFVYTPPDNREIIPQPSEIYYLPDSTRVFLIDGAKPKLSPAFKNSRQLQVDGDLFLETPAGKKPLIVRTRLLVLTVTEPSVFRVIAFNKDDGEEVQVISGNIRVRKAYESQFNEPDTLRDNQLVMINITIDLMEKEKLDTRDLRAWRDTVKFPAVSPSMP